MRENSNDTLVARGYMSRVTCAGDSGQAWQLRTPYEQHRTFWRLFADQDTRDFLFREEIPVRRTAGAPRRFLVVSARHPKPAAGLTVETRDYAPQLENADRLRFSVRLSVTSAQPVERPTGSGLPLKGRGKVVDPVADALAGIEDATARRAMRRRWLLGDTDEEASKREAPLLVRCWLVPKLLRHGLAVAPSATRIVSYEPAMHQGRKSKDSITFSVAEFSGMASVVDAKLAAHVAFGGIGRGKSLGYGLLLFSRKGVAEALPRSAANEGDEEEGAPARP